MDLDKERRERMAKNQAMLASLGVTDAVASARAAATAEANLKTVPTSKPRKPRAPAVSLPQRRSGRIAGATAPEMVELDDNGMPIWGAGEDGEEGGGEGGEEGLMDLVGNNDLRLRAGRGAADLSDEQLAEVNRIRTSSKSRGTLYAHLGICCHFCRQKKLCGEEDCPRCAHLNGEAECIGKSKCSRCMSSTGMFCRACLDCRYGLELEAVRADPNWMCAHCYEQEHGPWEKHGWFCNSSFCMQAAGMKETGIAIHEAKRLGYRSVAHWLQALTLAMSPSEVASIKAKAAAKSKSKRRKPARTGKKQTTRAKGKAGKAEADADAAEQEGPEEAAEEGAVEEVEQEEEAEEQAEEQEGEKRGRKRKAAEEPPAQEAQQGNGAAGEEEEEEEEEEEGHTQQEPSSSKGGAELDRSVEAGVELEAVEVATAGAAAGEQSAEEADGLDVPLLKRRRVGRKEAAAAEAKAQQEEAVAACKADEPLAIRRRTTRTARVRA
ncbi:hypothetical protein HXX76_006057 [Chlamydomonas incerta]|uniref:Zinc-finger domain-containing protein n=1 Tax=Chlamydomonas incerta TaxID=51695 RepID=A0A835TGM5_CHLIN|nr:hypothetical protein HXX76_006057 [Chlamydomonas incerta]|eukprot:KAG2437405.1 hypothetical protein HXX76_006057 [Chlamydomonas incerta]